VKNYGLDTRIDRLLQACIPVSKMGFPHPTQFGLGDPQLGLLLACAFWVNNESLSLWDVPLKLWDEFAKANAMDAFLTSPRSFQLFTRENPPLYGEVMQLKRSSDPWGGGGGDFNFII
jgi:hypothetical protein